MGRAVEPGSIKLNALPCVWFPTLGLRAASRLNGYYHWRRIVGEDARHRRQVGDVAVHHAEERADRFLVGGDAVEIAHLSKSCGLDDLFLR